MHHLRCQLIGRGRHRQVLGQCESAITHRRALLKTIDIDRPHRQRGYGSFLLKQAEKQLFFECGVRVVTVVAWQPQGDSTRLFYEKNGYTPMPTPVKHEQYYDDGETVYELLPYIKFLDSTLIDYRPSIAPDPNRVDVVTIGYATS